MYDSQRLYFQRPNLIRGLAAGDRIYGEPLMLGIMGLSGCSLIWHAVTVLGVWAILVSNDTAVSTADSNFPPSGLWLDITAKFPVGIITNPTGVGIESDWMNFANVHAAFIRFDFLVDPAAPLPPASAIRAWPCIIGL